MRRSRSLKDRERASLANIGSDERGAVVEGRKDAMEQEAHHGQDYYVRRSGCLTVETQVSKLYLQRYSVGPLNILYRQALDYCSYNLVDNSWKYDGNIAKKIEKLAKRLQTPMQLHTFNAIDPVYVFSFLSTLKLACESSGIHEGATMSLFFS